MKRFLITVVIIATGCQGASLERLGDFLMWFPGGGNPYLSPSNAVASIEEVARLQAGVIANASAADLLQQAMVSVDGRISQVEDVIAAQERTLYIDRYNVLRLGEQVQADESDAIMRVVKDDWAIGRGSTYQTNALGGGWCSVDPGFMPYVRIEKNLSSTNEWDLGTVTSQTTEHDVLIGETLYDTLYRVEFLTPIGMGAAFGARLSVEVRGTSTNSTFFVANNGFSVKGNKPVSFDLTVGTTGSSASGADLQTRQLFQGTNNAF